MKFYLHKNALLYILGKAAQKKSKKYLDYLTDNFAFDCCSKKILRRKKVPFQILIYHRVLPIFDPFANHVTTCKAFEKQIRYLSSYFHIVSLDQLVNDLINKSVKSNTLCLTFDDGYADNYRYVFPILKKYKVSATLFLTTDFISSNKILWFDQVLHIIKHAKIDKLDLEKFNGPGIDLNGFNTRRLAANTLLEWLKTLIPFDRDIVIKYLEEKCNISDKESGPRMLNWKEVREMSRDGIHFGSHTKTHPILSKISSQQMRLEVLESKAAIEGQINKEVTSFAYPNGQINDFNQDCINHLQELGYRCAVTTLRGNNYDGTDPFRLHRFSHWDREPIHFLGRAILNRFIF